MKDCLVFSGKKGQQLHVDVKNKVKTALKRQIYMLDAPIPAPKKERKEKSLSQIKPKPQIQSVMFTQPENTIGLFTCQIITSPRSGIKFFLISKRFFSENTKKYAPARDWRPLSGEVLDPPLLWAQKLLNSP